MAAIVHEAHPVPVAAAAAVRASGVTKRYRRGGPAVLDGIDLSVEAGDFVCVIGASGCGKSTLLSLLAGLEPVSAGRIEVGGMPVGTRGGNGAALMFQEPALLPWLTAAGNVELALRLRGVPRNQRGERAAELLELVRLGGAGGKRVHELSGGMRQRVALARALAQDRSLLLMDEPFAALDAITRDLLHDELERIWTETGRTVVFVTHNVREAVRLGRRVLLMASRPGRIAGQWRVDIDGPRRIEAPAVASLASEITTRLREEILRHGH